MNQSKQDKPFWQQKKLTDMSEQEWELLCDGCGLCCYRKYITGEEEDGDEELHFTRIACNQLNLVTGRCRHYKERFQIEEDCTKLTKADLEAFDWLPTSCAYRLLHEGKELPEWHPLITGNKHSVRQAGIQILNGIHEKDVIDWFEFVISTEKL